MKRPMLHCQMSQVVNPSEEINWLSLKQEVLRQELRHMVGIGQSSLARSLAVSHRHLSDKCVFVPSSL